MSQDVTIRMPDGTTRQISDTHEPKTSSFTRPDGTTVSVVEWTPKSDELAADLEGAIAADALEAELESLLRHARELQRANFNLIRLLFPINHGKEQRIIAVILVIRYPGEGSCCSFKCWHTSCRIC